MNKERLLHIFKMIDYDKLTEWEHDFMISIEEKYVLGTRKAESLSEKQIEVIERIYKNRQ